MSHSPINSGSREGRKTDTESPTSSQKSEKERDDDYLQKLSKFNKWRQSNSLKSIPDIKERRRSQMDFPELRNNSTRLSLGNPRHANKSNHNNLVNKSTQEENEYTNMSPKKKNDTGRSSITPRKNNESNRVSKSPANKSHNGSLQSDKNKSAGFPTEFSPELQNLFKTSKNFDSDSEAVNNPNSFEGHESADQSLIDKFYNKSSLPFVQNEDCDEGYQKVINKHGEVVEYAIPYNERLVEENVSRLPKINEHNREISPDHSSIHRSHSSKYCLDSHNIHNLNRYQYRPQAVPRRRRMSDIEVKFMRNTDTKPIDRDYVVEPDGMTDKQSHNKEFLEAIEDLVSLGQWSTRQLENKPPDLPPRSKHQNKNKKAVDKPILDLNLNGEKVNKSLSDIHEINPYFYKSRQILKLDDLEWVAGSIRGHPEGALAWGTAKWGCQTVSIRAPRPLLSQMQRAKSGMARDIHILTNMYHPNVALLMAVAFYDNYQVASVIEPCPATLSQILHHKPRTYPVPLDKALQYLQQICSAVSFLQNRGYIHTNISSHTILVTQSLVTAKLCGFELAVSIDSPSTLKYDKPKISCKEKIKQNLNDIYNTINRSKRNTPTSGDKTASWESSFLESMHNDSHKKLENESDGSYDSDNINDKKSMPPPETWNDYVWGEPQELADRELLGQHNWQAPELFWEENGLVRACTCSDVFALSVVLWECYTIKIPWADKNYNEIADNYLKNISLDLSHITHHILKSIIKKGFVMSPLERTMRPIDMQLHLKLAEEQIVGNTIQDPCWYELSLRTPPTNIEHPTRLKKETASSSVSPSPNSEAHYENIPANGKYESEIPEKDVNKNSLNRELSDEEIKQRTATQIIAQIEENNKFKKANMSLNLKEIKEDSYAFPPTPSTGQITPITPRNKTDCFIASDSFKSPAKYQEIDGLSKISETTEDSNKRLESTNEEENNPVKSSSSKTLLLNITPKFYTPLEIVSPSISNGDPEYKIERASKSYNGDQDNNSYSFNIGNYSLPDTPIARNTKLRKNAWLTNQKHKSEISHTRKKRFSFSFSGVNSNKTENIHENYSKSLIEGTDNSGNVLSKLLKPLNINMKSSNQDVPDLSSPILPTNATSTPVNANHKDGEENNHKPVSVRSKLCILFAEGLNNTSANRSPPPCCPMSKSFPVQNKTHTYRSRPCSPLIKPASHRTEAGCTESHVCSSLILDSAQISPPLYPAYRNEAIKPASHQEEIGVPTPSNNSLNFIRTSSQLDFYDSCSSSSDLQGGNNELTPEVARVPSKENLNHVTSSPVIYRSYAEIFSSPVNGDDPPTADKNISNINSSNSVEPSHYRKNIRASSAREGNISSTRAIKPASHSHGVDIMSPLMNKNNASFSNVTSQIREAVARRNVPKKDVSTRFENSLWKNEKNKCVNSMHSKESSKNKSALLQDTIPKNMVQIATNTPRTETRDSEIQTDKECAINVQYGSLAYHFNKLFTRKDRINKIPEINLKTPVKQIFNDDSAIYSAQTSPTPRRHSNTKSRKRLQMGLHSDSKYSITSDVDGVDILEDKTNDRNSKLSCVKKLDRTFNTSSKQNIVSNKYPVSLCTTCGSDLSQSSLLSSKSDLPGLSLSTTLKELHNLNILCSTDAIWPALGGSDTVSLSSSYNFSTKVLRHYQPLQRIQSARSTEDLYIDDDFTSGNLGVHMQLRYDRRLSCTDLFKELGLDNPGSAYSLNSQTEEENAENIQEIEETNITLKKTTKKSGPDGE